MQFVNDLLEHATSGNNLIALIVAIGYAITSLKQNRKEGQTGTVVEDAKQASGKVYIEQLAETRKLLVDERAAWSVERAELRAVNQRQHEQHEAEREDWRRANRDIGDRFERALVQFREAQAVSDHERGVLVEDSAEWKGKAEVLQFEKIDLMASIQRKAVDEAEVKRTLVAGKEREIGILASENERLRELNHELINQLHGDGTATGILGPLGRKE